MAGFLKIRYNAGGLLKNRIINADAIDFIEPFSLPAGRYVDETRARIAMKDGTLYDLSLTLDEIRQLLQEAGAFVAGIHSALGDGPPQPAAEPVNLYKRPTVVKSAPNVPRKTADAARGK